MPAALAFSRADEATLAERHPPAGRPQTRPGATLTVCTGRRCLKRGDIAALAQALRQAAAASGAPITLALSPCLDRCDQGPVVRAASADGEQLFVHVTKRDMEEIIQAARGREQ